MERKDKLEEGYKIEAKRTTIMKNKKQKRKNLTMLSTPFGDPRETPLKTLKHKEDTNNPLPQKRLQEHIPLQPDTTRLQKSNTVIEPCASYPSQSLQT